LAYDPFIRGGCQGRPEKPARFPGEDADAFVLQQLFRWFAAEGIDNKAVRRLAEGGLQGTRRRKGFFFEQVIGQEFVDPAKSVIVGSNQGVKQLVIVPDLCAEDRFDPFPAAVPDEVPGVAGGIDVGEGERGSAGFDAGHDQLFCGKGSVFETKIGFGEIHRRFLWKQSYELPKIFSY